MRAARLIAACLLVGCATPSPLPPAEPIYTVAVLDARTHRPLVGAQVDVVAMPYAPKHCDELTRAFAMPGAYAGGSVSGQTDAQGRVVFRTAPPSEEQVDCPAPRECATPPKLTHYFAISAPGYVTFRMPAAWTAEVSLMHSDAKVSTVDVARERAFADPRLAWTRDFPDYTPRVCLSPHGDWSIDLDPVSLPAHAEVDALPGVSARLDPDTGALRITSCPSEGSEVVLLRVDREVTELRERGTGVTLRCEARSSHADPKWLARAPLAIGQVVHVFSSSAASCEPGEAIDAIAIGRTWTSVGLSGRGGVGLANLERCTRIDPR